MRKNVAVALAVAFYHFQETETEGFDKSRNGSRFKIRIELESNAFCHKVSKDTKDHKEVFHRFTL